MYHCQASVKNSPFVTGHQTCLSTPSLSTYCFYRRITLKYPYSLRKAPRKSLQLEIQSALFDPPPFNPDKLTIIRLPGGSECGCSLRRRYTLTHNDLTGSLKLSIGQDYNIKQLAGWYTKFLRDEVLAELSYPHCEDAALLNLFCHVSGEEVWPAPPPLRSFIFRREMTLVLDTIAYAERDLIEKHPSIAAAAVRVHLVSDIPELNSIIDWGSLGDRSSWRKSTSGTNNKTTVSQLLKWLLPSSTMDSSSSGDELWLESASIDDAVPEDVSKILR